MTEKLLRNALKEAKEKGHSGLLIWENQKIWNDLASDLEIGNESYDFALSQISKGNAAVILVKWNGISVAGLVAAPVQKLDSSDEFFRNVLKVCKRCHCKGPIVFVP